MTHPIDIHVGQRIRRRRWMIGMTQKQLAAAVGVKFQQIQKYETGMNRVSASRLFEISQALDVSIRFFFDQPADPVADTAIENAMPQPPQSDPQLPAELFEGREAVELLRCYYRWPAEQRQKLLDLTRSISEAA